LTDPDRLRTPQPERTATGKETRFSSHLIHNPRAAKWPGLFTVLLQIRALSVAQVPRGVDLLAIASQTE
jgi:hypothetical protein